jgi:hypothetical protein
VNDIDNLLLIIGGLAAASCFAGAAVYLMSVFNQTQYSNSKNNETLEDLDTIE